MDRSSRSALVLLSTSAVAIAGCAHSRQPVAAPQPARPVAVAPAPAPVPVHVAIPQAPPAPPIPAPIIIKDAGLQTPECVLWDADQDVYFVSNINGDPTAFDKNGFISKIGPDGKVIDLKWIDGSKRATELNAPKGMVIAGGILYVADIDVVRKFDHKTGKPKGKIAVKNAVFLNALTVSPDGKTLYVSDSAVKIKDGQFSGTGADAIYAIDIKKRSVKPLIQDKTLFWPNGVLADNTGVWVVTLARNELVHVNYMGEMGSVTKLPKGSLDGIVRLPDNSLLISSWEGSAVYRGLPGGEFQELISGATSPAAIGLDGKRNAVLIPIFMGSAVEIHTLPTLPPLESPVPATVPAAATTSPGAPGSANIPAPELPPATTRAPAAAPAPQPRPVAPAPPPPPAPAAAPAPAAQAPAAAPASSGSKPTRWE